MWGQIWASAVWGLWGWSSSVLSTCTELYCCTSHLTMPRPLLVHAINHLALFAADRHSHSAGEIWLLHTHIHLWNINLVYLLSIDTLVSSYQFLQKGREAIKAIRFCFHLGTLVSSQRRFQEIHLHGAWCTISLNVTMSLTKEDKRIGFGQECLLSYKCLWSPVQRWIAPTS